MSSSTVEAIRTLVRELNPTANVLTTKVASTADKLVQPRLSTRPHVVRRGCQSWLPATHKSEEVMRRFTKVLVGGAILIAVFGASFFFFYRRAQQTQAGQPLILTAAVLNQPLPQADLINLAGKSPDDAKLRHGG